MKILMTADPIGGVWRYALELCAALRPYGIHVMLATLGGQLTDRQRLEARRVGNIMLREGQFRLEWMESPWESLEAAGDWLLSLEREFEPAIVHLNHLAHGDLLWRAPVLVVGHSCVLSWLEAVRGRVEPGFERYKDCVKRSLERATRVVAPTQAMMQALERHYGPFPSAQIITNGVDPEPFQALSKQRIILTAGRLWDEAKNVQALCSVADSVAWPIFVAGTNAGPDGQAQQLSGVRPLGSLPSPVLKAWYSGASIYALPARYEPFGLTVLEAALSQCALVLGDIPSLREVWDGAARYVPPNDTSALRQTLNELIADEEEIALRGALARARAHCYTSEEMAAQYWNTYWSLMREKGNTTCASYSSTTH